MIKFFKSLIRASKYGFACGCTLHCIAEFVGDVYVCSGPSMEPSIYTRDVILTERVTPLNKIKKGDIVILRSPSNPHRFICKRVSGVFGEKIKNGNDYSSVPQGHIWVSGDNEQNSIDSRSYGAVPLGLVRGRAFVRIWPFNSIGTLFDNVKYKNS